MQLIVDHIHCSNTTEQGHDEVYLSLMGSLTDQHLAPVQAMVNGKMCSDFGVRVPNPSQAADADPNGENGAFTAWDCNDDGGPLSERALGIAVLDVAIPADSRLTLTLMAMESDGWSYWNSIDAFASGGIVVAGIASNPQTAPTTVPTALDGLGKLEDHLRKDFPLINTDDHLGSMLMHFTNIAGQQKIDTVVYNDGAKSWGASGAGADPWSNKVHLLGDGGDYLIDFTITGASASRQVADLQHAAHRRHEREIERYERKRRAKREQYEPEAAHKALAVG